MIYDCYLIYESMKHPYGGVRMKDSQYSISYLELIEDEERLT